nr:dihydrofolate reductase [Leptinotarsa decemlineata]
MSPKLKMISAACENMGIGKDNNLPWKLKSEMEHFRRITSKTKDPHKKNVVIMGRKTWDSIPPKYRPMRNRINFVLSRSDLDLRSYEASYSFKNLEECIKKLEDEDFKKLYENAWVIGGSRIYAEAMKSEYFYQLYLTRILKTFDCDTFFPELPDNLVKVSDPDVPEGKQIENDIEFIYNVYQNPNFSN